MMELETALDILHKEIPPTLAVDPDYIPLRAAPHANMENYDFDLDEHMDEFFAKERKVMLMLGDSGAGKSVYAQFLMERLWKSYIATPQQQPLPLFISLPRLKDPVNNAIEEVLKSYGLTSEQIEKLKQTQKFIFILDAYDEIRINKNLLVTNKLEEWNAKIIITCRTQYLHTIENYNQYFMPYENERSVPWLFTEVHLKPFNQTQIEKYLHQYVNHHDVEWKDWKIYLKHIEEIPGLKKLIQTPFLLKLAVEAMPEVVKLFAEQNNKQENGKEEESANNNAKQKLLKMTQAKLYDVFVAQWFDRQEKKLIEAKQIKPSENIKARFWEYAKGLSKELFAYNITQIVYEAKDDLFGEAQTETTNPFEKYFDERDPQTRILRTSTLLQQTGKNQYGFLHSSLIDYFVSKDFYETAEPNKQLEKTESKKPTQETWLDKELKKAFNQRLIVKEQRMLRFNADRIEEDTAYKKYMFDLIDASKQMERIQIAASNAISVLNYARISFSGMDLSNIKISSANLQGAFLDHTDLSNADLTEVDLSQSWLRYSNLLGAKLKNIQLGELVAFKHDGTDLLQFVVDKSGQYLAAVSGLGCNVIFLWDLKKSEQIGVFAQHNKAITRLKFSDDSLWLASCGYDPVAYIWNVKTGEINYRLEHSSDVTDIAFAPNNSWVATVSFDHRLCIWDLLAGKNVYTVETLSNRLWIHPNGQYILSVDHSGLVQICEFPFKNPTPLRIDGAKPMRATKFAAYPVSNGDYLLAMSCVDNTVRLRRIFSIQEAAAPQMTGMLAILMNMMQQQSQQMAGAAQQFLQFNKTHKLQEWSLEGHCAPINQLKFSNNGKLLATASNDHSIRIWDLDSKICIQEIKNSQPVTALAFNEEGTILASATADNIIKLWSTEVWKCFKIFYGHTAGILDLYFNADDSTLVSASHDKTVRRWQVNVSTQTDQVSAPVAYSEVVTNLKKITGKSQLITTDDKNNIVIWNSQNGNLNNQWQLPGEKNISALSPDGWLLFVAAEGTIKKYDAISGECKGFLPQKLDNISDIVSSYSGDKVALLSSSSLSYRISVWEPTTKKIWDLTDKHLSKVTYVIFSNDNQWLLTGDDNGQIHVWDIFKQTCLFKFTEHDSTITALAISKSGSLMASSATDRTVRIWKLNKTNPASISMKSMTEVVDKLEFSSDDYHLAIGEKSRVYALNISTNQYEYFTAFFKITVNALTWSDNGKLLAIGTSNNEIVIWDKFTKIVTTLRGYINPVVMLCFIAQDCLISASQNGTLKKWQLIQGQIAPEWQLQWSTQTEALVAENANINKVIELGSDSQKLLDQLGVHKNSPLSALHLAAAKGNVNEIKNLSKQIDINSIAGENGWTTLHYAVASNQLDSVNIILTLSPNLDLTDKEGRTVVHLAAMFGFNNILELLLNAKAKVNSCDALNRTPLHLAAIEGKAETVALLVSKGANLEAKDNEHLTPLFAAIISESNETVRKLLQLGANVEAESFGRRPLMAAAGRGLDAIVGILLEYKATCEAPKSEIVIFNISPLHAAAYGGHARVVDMLIIQGKIPVDIKDEQNDQNSLHIAAFSGDVQTIRVLLKHKADVNNVNRHGDQPLLIALGRNNIEAVEELLINGANANAIQSDGKPALHLAAQFGFSAIIKLLVKYKANFNEVDEESNTALHRAVIQGKEEVVALLVELGADLEAVNKNKQTPLTTAACRGNQKMVALLLKLGASIKPSADLNVLPLHMAISPGRSVKTVEELIKSHVDIEQVNATGDRPLHVAAFEGLHEIADFLLENKADKEAISPGNLGFTALGIACQRGHTEVLKILLKFKANPRTKNNLGVEPLVIAALNASTDIVEILLKEGIHPDTVTFNNIPIASTVIMKGNTAVLKILAKYGANLEIALPKLGAPLHFAAAMGNEPMAQILLENRVNIEIRNDEQWTPLHLATRSSAKNIIALLLTAGANIEATEKSGGTAMHIAASVGNLDVFNLLVERGAKLDTKAANGMSPLHAAAQLNRAQIISGLVTKNVAINARDNSGMTPLHYAVQGNHFSSVLVLLNMKATPNVSDDYGNNPLHYAALTGNESIGLLLLEHGVDPLAKNKEGKTPAELADMKNFGKFAAAMKLTQEEAKKLNAQAAGNDMTQQLGKLAFMTQIIKLKTAADSLQKEKKFVEAAKCLEELLVIVKKSDGEEAVEVGHALLDYGRVLVELTQAKKAIDNLKQAANIFRKKLGDGNVLLSISIDELAYALEGLGDLRAARNVIEEALATSEKINGKNHESFVVLSASLGRVLKALGDTKSAVTHYHNSLEICKKLNGEQHIRVGIGLYRYARALKDDGDIASALTYLNQAETILTASEPADSQFFVWYWMGRCEVDQASQKFIEAIAAGEKALQLAEKLNGSVHFDTYAALICLMQTQFAAGNFEAAKSLANRALQIGVKLYQEPHCDYGKVLHQLGLLFEREGELGKAKFYFNQALTIFKARLPGDHQRIKAIESKLQAMIPIEEVVVEIVAVELPKYRTIDEQINALLILVNEAIGKNDITKGIEYYEKIIALNPNHQNAQQNLACYYHVQAVTENNPQRIPEAEMHFKKAMELNPHSGVCADYGNFLFAEKRYPEVIQLLAAALQRQSDGRAVGYGKIDKHTLPQELIAEVEDQSTIAMSGRVFIYYLLFNSYLMNNQQALAEKLLPSFIEEVEKKPEALYYSLLGYAFEKLLQYDKSMGYFEKATKLKQNYPLAMKNYEKLNLLLSAQQTANINISESTVALSSSPYSFIANIGSNAGPISNNSTQLRSDLEMTANTDGVSNSNADVGNTSSKKCGCALL